MLLFNFGYWEFWETYSPVGGPTTETGPGAPAFGNQKVSFDGENKLILINFGETSINVGDDIYSNWKEWMQVRENAKFAQAMSAIGGQPTVGVQKVGTTYFLENGWRIRTWEGDHRLQLEGNLFTTEGDSPFVPTLFEHNIFTELKVSNLVDLAKSPLSTSEAAQLFELWRLAGLDSSEPLTVTTTSRTVGTDIVQDIDGVDPGPVTVTRQ